MPSFSEGQPDRLVGAECARVNVSLTFADGFTKKTKLAELGIRPTDYNLKTLRVSIARDTLLLNTLKGEPSKIDSSTLRSDLDPDCATALRDAILALRGAIAELKKARSSAFGIGSSAEVAAIQTIAPMASNGCR